MLARRQACSVCLEFSLFVHHIQQGRTPFDLCFYRRSVDCASYSNCNVPKLDARQLSNNNNNDNNSQQSLESATRLWILIRSFSYWHVCDFSCQILYLTIFSYNII